MTNDKFQKISNIVTIMLFIAAVFSIVMQLMNYFIFNIKMYIYGINDKMLFSFNLYDTLILIVSFLLLLFIAYVYDCINNSDNFSNYGKIWRYIFLFICAQLLLFFTSTGFYADYNVGVRFIANCIIIVAVILLYFDFKKNIYPQTLQEIENIKNEKNIFFAIFFRLSILMICFIISFGFAFYLAEILKQQYMVNDKNQPIVYLNSDYYIIVNGKYNEKENIYYYNYGSYILIDKESVNIKTHIFTNLQKNDSVGE